MRGKWKKKYKYQYQNTGAKMDEDHEIDMQHISKRVK